MALGLGKTQAPARLLPGKYRCWDNDYMNLRCVVNVKETDHSFTLKIDEELSAKAFVEGTALGRLEPWDIMSDLTKEFVIEESNRRFEMTPFKNGKLIIKKSGSKHPLYVRSETEFDLNPYWGGTLYTFYKI